MSRNILILCVFLLALQVQGAFSSCEDIPWRRGKPFDFYSAEVRARNGTFPTGLLHMVEQAHFTPNVQSLAYGQNGYQPDDILFVLSSMPNHPGGLDAYSRYVKRYRESKSFRDDKNNHAPKYMPDCFFFRAISIYGGYSETRRVFGLHYYRNQNYEKAIEEFAQAEKMGDQSADLFYYLGLVFLKVGDVERASEYAGKAYALGYPLQALKEELNKVLKKERK